MLCAQLSCGEGRAAAAPARNTYSAPGSCPSEGHALSRSTAAARGSPCSPRQRSEPSGALRHNHFLLELSLWSTISRRISSGPVAAGLHDAASSSQGHAKGTEAAAPWSLNKLTAASPYDPYVIINSSLIMEGK